jgi:hypothetical protein
VILTVSCEKEAENAIYPKFVPKTVVSCYISPDEAKCELTLGSNSPIYGDLQYNPTEAVKVYFSGHELLYDTVSQGFPINKTEIPIIEGKTYNLDITGDQGLSISSSCTVPYKRNFYPEIDTVKKTGTYSYNDTVHTYHTVYAFFHFTDFLDDPNYYAIFPELVTYNSKYIHNPSIGTLNIDDPGSQVYFDHNNYFTDKGFEGKRISIPLGGTVDPVMDPVYADSMFLKVYLLNIDKTYFEFKKSLTNYSSGENPLVEPSPVYSNIIGGLGIFASYTMDSLIFRLK